MYQRLIFNTRSVEHNIDHFGYIMKLRLNILVYIAAIVQCACVAALLQSNDIRQYKDEHEIIHVTEELYKELQYGVEGEYSVLYITIYSTNEDGSYKCPMCLEFEETIHGVQEIIKKQRPDIPISYYIVDAYEVPSLIKDMGIENVPHLVVYPPINMMKQETEPFSWAKGQFYQYELTPDHSNDVLHFGDFLAQVLNIYIEVEEDFDTGKFMQYFVGSTIAFVFLKKVIWPIVKKGNVSKIIMMIIAFSIMLPSLTGYKFTQMNRIPLIARNDEGNIMYFSGGTGWQFGLEMFTVSLMYIGMGVLFISLIILKSDFIQEKINEKVDSLLTLLFGYALFYLFSYYISCFDIKSPGYAYGY
ncbi:similar to Saccharomyces cerevisiae YML019W OST6 Subunit of the oligosaccharyltransferase complex of the ER lumen, which catalyzes asparagine-linked glycosylation of newly synthesized proteins [Maudiozyma barnettii]|uniref:Similar to Saccharomyces cerevisiae YML019W OST6 Subunit of the oligosaccharyltransferase complex of the ER lumen, which catalyzes asparagine-linked glycosylation of newly synthesized proteins n=1 Tax=Maudiozyma barnettii TaxID=61262 RepID=A0A8H2ZLR8_9SACH|nr:dolichyl-diphosphooligosaccharide--protein glycotransferase [Kazachstania barnettii]CAB4256357.1 similar to Saccharomyces cerevisiae YML019W OST6 Subunit of the oligosaccharyltransferase complex of the ER lumen, which catalyzes asparagine-linked glycosylation of newly synthesized proteins [Kazachstania barnettii]CAD1784966.1 similar to Saccharomyces cerevisiae YML019W OST6 Subunit of the oligosaccharyltransferase complex of the ER lumen, which catalyzes asparagine-linked glycosylation of newly